MGVMEMDLLSGEVLLPAEAGLDGGSSLSLLSHGWDLVSLLRLRTQSLLSPVL